MTARLGAGEGRGRAVTIAAGLTLRDFGEGRMGHAASDWGEGSLASCSSGTTISNSEAVKSTPCRRAAARIESWRHDGMSRFVCHDLTVEGGTSPSLAAIGRMPPNFWKTLAMMREPSKCE